MTATAQRTDSDALRAAEALFRAGRTADAMAACDDALSRWPDNVAFLNLRAVLAIGSGDALGGEAFLRRAIAAAPGDAQAHRNLAALLAGHGRIDEALPLFERAVACNPDDAGTLENFARALRQRGRLAEAERLLRHASATHPARAEPLHGLGLIAAERDDRPGAVTYLERAAQLAPRSVTILADLGSAYRAAERIDEALDTYRRALAIDPDDETIPARLEHQLARVCAWEEAASVRTRLLARSEAAFARSGRAIELPFAQLAYQTDKAAILRLARAWSADIARRAGVSLPTPAIDRTPGRPLRIGFLSHDFRNHAVSELSRGVLATLDRGRFHVAAYSTGPDDGSALRRAMTAAVDVFRDVRNLSHRDAATTIRNDAIDILVDLTGHTAGSRLEIAALRPAPLQVSWLGYPATTGAAFIDALIADATVIPAGEERFYSERVVRLPYAYLPMDNRQPIAGDRPSRAAQGLPETGFVFCSFNNMHKIEPVMFDLWMGLLRDVPGSVLWLHAYSDRAAANLRKAAAARGVDPVRLVFADRPTKDRHLARAGLADLALDTRLYNGHTTTIDMLWAGVPVVTVPGETFQARVSASLLAAAGLPELIASDLNTYRKLALDLARNPTRLAVLKQRLAQNRTRAPLFDTEGFAGDLGQVFTGLWQEVCDGRVASSNRRISSA